MATLPPAAKRIARPGCQVLCPQVFVLYWGEFEIECAHILSFACTHQPLFYRPFNRQTEISGMGRVGTTSAARGHLIKECPRWNLRAMEWSRQGLGDSKGRDRLGRGWELGPNEGGGSTNRRLGTKCITTTLPPFPFSHTSLFCTPRRVEMCVYGLRGRSKKGRGIHTQEDERKTTRSRVLDIRHIQWPE